MYRTKEVVLAVYTAAVGCRVAARTTGTCERHTYPLVRCTTLPSVTRPCVTHVAPMDTMPMVLHWGGAAGAHAPARRHVLVID